MRIARENERIDADVHVLLDPSRNSLGIADQRRARASAHETDARPEVRTDLELVAAAAVKRDHPLLAHRIHARENLLSRFERIVCDVGDQLVGCFPRRFAALAHDYVQPDTEAELAALGG